MSFHLALPVANGVKISFMHERGEGFDFVNLERVHLEEIVAHGGEGCIGFHRILDDSQIDGMCSFVDLAVLPPGRTIGRHTHRDGEEEFYLILDGRGTMWRDGREFRVQRGDLIRNRPGGAHGLCNDGPGDLRLFVFELKVVVVEVVGVLLISPDGLLLEKRPATARYYAGLWDTPGGKVEAGETPAQALAREMGEELGIRLLDAQPLGVLKDREPASGIQFHHHGFVAEKTDRLPTARLGQTLIWTPPERLPALTGLNPIVRRFASVWLGRDPFDATATTDEGTP